MKKDILYDNFITLRNKIISNIYLQQILEWYSLFSNKDIDILTRLMEEAENSLNELEASSFANETVLAVLENANLFDINTIKEAQIIKDRIKKRKEQKSDNRLITTRIKSQRALVEARNYNDFSLVKGCLKDIIKIKQSQYTGDNKYYKVLQEKIVDMSFKDVDNMFTNIKSMDYALLISPEYKSDNKYTKQELRNIVDYLIKILGIDNSRLEIKNYADSFMMSFGSQNVKLALNFDEINVLRFLKTACHELGHVLYEQNNLQEFDNTFLSGGASTTFHEAMAYFFEHHIGESEHIKQIIQQACGRNDFTQTRLDGPNPIRTSANSINYPFHILIRYEIEKGLINGDIGVDDIQCVWRDLYKKYLNINIKNDNEGILQDPHWFNAQFGYFPSYIIGRAYVSQLYAAMSKHYNFSQQLLNQDLSEIISWLKENIYQFGASNRVKDIIKDSTGESFNSKYYIDEIQSR